MNRIHLMLGSALLLAPSMQASTLGTAADFNVFTLGDFAPSGADTTGRVAVGGNATFSTGYGINSTSAAGTYALIVGGNLTKLNNSGGSIIGGVAVGGNFNYGNPTIGGNTIVGGNFNSNNFGSINGNLSYVGSFSSNATVSGTTTHVATYTSPINFQSAATELKNDSTSFAALAANGVTTANGTGVKFTGVSSSLNVFSITAANLAMANGQGLTITAPGSSTVLINVLVSGGAAPNLTGFSFNFAGGIDRTHVLFNYVNADNSNTPFTISMGSIGFDGSILAPLGNFNGLSGNTNGNMIFNSVLSTNTTEFHNFLFNGTINTPVATPEPATGLMMLSAGLAACLMGRKLTGTTITKQTILS